MPVVCRVKFFTNLTCNCLTNQNDYHYQLTSYTKICTNLSGIIYNTVWQLNFVGANFRGKSEKALKINFRGFEFRDSNQSRALLYKR